MEHDAGASGEWGSSPETRTGYIPGETFAAKEVVYAVIDSNAVFEGDIVLGSVEEVERFTEAVRGQADGPAGPVLEGVVITGRGFRWPYALIPFEIDAALSNQARVTNAIQHWEERIAVRFVRRTPDNQALYPDFVLFRPGGGCSAAVGHQGGQQAVNLADGCDTGSTIHEIGHA